MEKDQSAAANQGIQARTVNAEVLAVGNGASAIKNAAGGSGAEIAAALVEMRNALAELALTRESQRGIMDEIESFRASAAKGGSNPRELQGRLQEIVGRLKSAGIIVSESAGLIEPIKKIARLIGAALPWLGIG